MKKIILFLISLVISLSMINTTKANELDEYPMDIDNIEIEDTYTRSSFVENDIDIELIIDKDMRYVTVNSKDYAFDDFNKAMEIQANAIYDQNINMTIIDALKQFKPIDNLKEYLNELDISIIKETINLNKGISTCGYGTYYYVGKYNQTLLIALTSSALSIIFTYLTKGATAFVLTKASVKKWVIKFLGVVGTSKVNATTYVKRWQAVLNSHGTTKEKREAGFKYSKKIYWTGEYYYRTFETQRS